MNFILNVQSTNPDREKVRRVLEKELGFVFGPGSFDLDLIDDDHEIVIRKPRHFQGDRE